MPDPLIEHARETLADAYVPYSEYRVGAALRTADGEVFVGCNVENANYSNSLHAEEVAIAEAVKRGHREFDRIAVTSGVRDGVTPCGMCRQTLAEFCDDDLVIVCDEGGEETTEYTLGALLPDTISLGTLEAADEVAEGHPVPDGDA
jgi:cytidine deaminase